MAIERKVVSAAAGSAAAGATLAPLVLYVMAKLGDDPAAPLVQGAAVVIGVVLMAALQGAAALIAGYRSRSSTSAVSAGFDLDRQPETARNRVLDEAAEAFTEAAAEPDPDRGPPAA